MTNEWSRYRISFPDTENRKFTEGRVLETIYHVAHVPGARRILEDGRLKAGIVYDESKLRKSRVAVTWLSANSWAYGSIYGNVEFSFSWKKIAAGRNFYWLEDMQSYRPPAYRILLSDRELNSKYVQPYDPETDKGPLRKKDGLWYWNGDYTSEFMLERDIALEECTSFNFVSHHPEYCSLDGSACEYLGAPSHRIAGRILASIFGNDLNTIDHVLKRSESRLRETVDAGVTGIVDALGSKDERFTGGIKSPDSRRAVVKGALALFGTRQVKAARALIAILKSKDVFETALTELVNEHFGISGWALGE